MNVAELADAVLRSGGVLKLEGNNVKCSLTADTAHLAGKLREHKPELVALLRSYGGRIAAFPHCPQCASYALYRKDNIGLYECLTCGLGGIEESTARRLV